MSAATVSVDATTGTVTLSCPRHGAALATVWPDTYQCSFKGSSFAPVEDGLDRWGRCRVRVRRET